MQGRESSVGDRGGVSGSAKTLRAGLRRSKKRDEALLEGELMICASRLRVPRVAVGPSLVVVSERAEKKVNQGEEGPSPDR